MKPTEYVQFIYVNYTSLKLFFLIRKKKENNCLTQQFLKCALKILRDSKILSGDLEGKNFS